MKNKARGYSIITDPAFCSPVEIETFTCLHCSTVVDKPAFKSSTDDAIGAWCSCCDGPICLKCVGKGCRPIQRWLDRMEARRYIVECVT